MSRHSSELTRFCPKYSFSQDCLRAFSYAITFPLHKFLSYNDQHQKMNMGLRPLSNLCILFKTLPLVPMMSPTWPLSPLNWNHCWLCHHFSWLCHFWIGQASYLTECPSTGVCLMVSPLAPVTQGSYCVLSASHQQRHVLLSPAAVYVNFDYLIKVVSAMFLHGKFINFP